MVTTGDDDRLVLAELLGVEVAWVDRTLPAPVRRHRPIERWDLPDPFDTDTGTWFVAGDPALVLLAVGHGRVIVADPEVTWHSQVPILGIRGQVERPLNPGGVVLAWLPNQIRATRRLRRRRFRTCAECRQRKPPESMHGPALCQSCAERNHGVVH